MQLHARWQLSQPQAIKVSVVPMSLFKSMMLIKCHSLVSSSHTNLTDPTQIMTDLWNSLISAGEESLIEGSSSFLMFVLTEEYLTLLVMVVATYTSIKSTSCWRRCWKKRWVQNVTDLGELVAELIQFLLQGCLLLFCVHHLITDLTCNKIVHLSLCTYTLAGEQDEIGKTMLKKEGK